MSRSPVPINAINGLSRLILARRSLRASSFHLPQTDFDIRGLTVLWGREGQISRRSSQSGVRATFCKGKGEAVCIVVLRHKEILQVVFHDSSSRWFADPTDPRYQGDLIDASLRIYQRRWSSWCVETSGSQFRSFPSMKGPYITIIFNACIEKQIRQIHGSAGAGVTLDLE